MVECAKTAFWDLFSPNNLKCNLQKFHCLCFYVIFPSFNYTKMEIIFILAIVVD